MIETLGATCPVVDLDSNICLLAGQEVACNLIRECDHLTGAVHFEYALPGGNTNANIWVLQSDGDWEFHGPDAPNVPPPTLPAEVQPVFYEPPPAVVVPAAALPAPAPILAVDEAPPPAGIWNFQAAAAILPNLGPAPAASGAGPGNGLDTFLDDLAGDFSLGDKLGTPIAGIPLWLILALGAGAYFLVGSRR